MGCRGQRHAHLANDVIRDGLEAATDQIVGVTRGVAVLTPPPFERLTDRQWKRIAAIVEATRGTCGGTRTDLRRAVDAIRWVKYIHDSTGNPRAGYVLRGPKDTRIKSIIRS